MSPDVVAMARQFLDGLRRERSGEARIPRCAADEVDLMRVDVIGQRSAGNLEAQSNQADPSLPDLTTAAERPGARALQGRTGARLDRAEAIEFRQVLPGTPAEIFPFFADAANLERITPPWLRFTVLTPAPIAMRPGTLIDYRLRWRVFPIRWRTLISTWDPPHRFVDEQIRGPYRIWHHEHTFERDGDTTVMRDRIHFLAPLSWISHPLTVRRDVERIFAHRREAIGSALAEWSSARNDSKADSGPALA